MANGNCPVGAKNTADIESLHREQKMQNKMIDGLTNKLDKLIYLVVATLAVALANLIF